MSRHLLDAAADATPPSTLVGTGAVEAPGPAGDGPVPSTRLRDIVPADRWTWVRIGLLGSYVLAYVVWFFAYGLIIDRISVLISVALLLVLAHVGRSPYRWGRLAVDMVLYTVMWLAYDESRGIADSLGRPIQVEAMRNIDRVLFLGTDPNVWMQRTFYSARHIRWYDVAASLVYYTHFVLPIAVIVVLWVSDRVQWVRFVRRFATVLLVACAMFVLVPTAPPWMAAGGSTRHPYEVLPSLARPTGRGWRYLGLQGFVHAWETGQDWANEVAAMPSLHAAFALFVVAFFLPRIRHRWVKAATFAFPLAMGAALVYLAEHWVIDVLAGWAVVGLSFLVWNRIERWLRRRRVAIVHGALDAIGSPEAVAP